MIALLQNHSGEDRIVRKFSFPGKNLVIAEMKKSKNDVLVKMCEVESYITNHVQSGQFDILKGRLIELEFILKTRYERVVDPIEYIMFLYYSEGLSVRDIKIRLNNLGVKFSRNSLQNLMSKICAWPLRGNNEGSKLTELKYKKMPEDFNKKRTTEIIDGNKKLVDGLLSHRKPFDQEEYMKLKNYPQRIAYIFLLSGVATDFESARKYVLNLNAGGFGMRSIAIIIKELFEKTIPVNSGLSVPKIDSSRVNKIFFKSQSQSPQDSDQNL